MKTLNGAIILTNVSCVQEQIHMRMSCPGKVTAVTVTMDGVYCAAGIGGIVHIWEVSKSTPSFYTYTWPKHTEIFT